MEEIYTGYCPTPIGIFGVQCTQQALVWAGFATPLHQKRASTEVPALLKQALQQVAEYFTGKRRIFELPLAPEGSAFYQSVWNKLLQIPYGETTSYGALAASLGKPKACRAVGNANHNNPIGLIIPCHRVIGSHGSLTGYASGLERKQWLLDWEKNYTFVRLNNT
ncbi:MAG: methylated-DNA--[protein]-cysteine S-methyltransferase [Bacteroidetes bacterium]|nr:methylated-DNA--[protein]-cysteine S-methyltransferase [Bacteroidota bacterium]